jgi:hypothetical protein
MKRRSVSSVLAERRKQRLAVTPVKHSVRYVKFTPEEMAYDPTPEETADWVEVGRGPVAIFAKPPKSRTIVLAGDVAKVFRNSAEVNNALRMLIEAVPVQRKNRKTA